MSRGGLRDGAGRPKGKAKRRITFRLEPVMITIIKTNAKALGVSESDYAASIFADSVLNALTPEQLTELQSLAEFNGLGSVNEAIAYCVNNLIWRIDK